MSEATAALCLKKRFTIIWRWLSPSVSLFSIPLSFASEVETVDLKIYREAESKAINIGEAEDILRRNAIDCHLNKDGNHYSEKDWGEKMMVKTSRGEAKKVSVYDQPFSHTCHYLKNCEYRSVEVY